MGPFSGFPAVNFAVSMGELTVDFDSSIPLPAAAATGITLHEQSLLKERFGIETIALDSKAQTANHPLPLTTTTQVMLPDVRSRDEASTSQDDHHKQSSPGDVRDRTSARETKTRARKSKGYKKEKQNFANGKSI